MTNEVNNMKRTDEENFNISSKIVDIFSPEIIEELKRDMESPELREMLDMGLSKWEALHESSESTDFIKKDLLIKDGYVDHEKDVIVFTINDDESSQISVPIDKLVGIMIEKDQNQDKSIDADFKDPNINLMIDNILNNNGEG